MRPNDWFKRLTKDEQRKAATTVTTWGLTTDEVYRNSEWYRLDEEYTEALVLYEVAEAEFDTFDQHAKIPRPPRKFWGKGPRPIYPPHVPPPPPEARTGVVTVSLPAGLIAAAERVSNASGESLDAYVSRAMRAVMDAGDLPPQAWQGMRVSVKLRLPVQLVADTERRWNLRLGEATERALTAIHPPQ